ncbi:MAG TPA: hypothetical protein VG518_08400 [Solirubrobacterales bacterium]|nr:hypothetical protein [Solirubrobacterales bacterium]
MALGLGAIGIKAAYVLAAITLFALPVWASALANREPRWRGGGKARFGIAPALPPARFEMPAPPVDRALQEAEARQMLEAKSYRRQRRGEQPIDVEAELARLLAPPGTGGPCLDERLRDEVRALVVAHNERRMRRGIEPLDVDSETERQLSDLVGLGT